MEQHESEQADIDGLAEGKIHKRAFLSQLLKNFGVSREHNDDLKRIFCFDSAGELLAGHASHYVVREDEIVAPFAEFLQSLGSTGDCFDVMTLECQ